MGAISQLKDMAAQPLFCKLDDEGLIRLPSPIRLSSNAVPKSFEDRIQYRIRQLHLGPRSAVLPLRAITVFRPCERLLHE